MRLEGQPGDLRIANERLDAVVSAAPAQAGFRRHLGRLLDLRAAGDRDDLLQSLGPALTLDDRPAKLQVTRVSEDPAGIAVIAAIEGHPGVGLRTVYGLRDDAGHVQIETTVTNRGATHLEIRGGDELYLGNIVPFVPGHGDVDDSARLSTHWFGFATRGQALAYCQGGVEAFDVQVPYLSIGNSPFTGAMTTTLVRAGLPPGGVVSWRSWVTAGADLASAAQTLYSAARTTVRRLRGRVEPMMPGLQVEVVSGGRPFTRVTPEPGGRFSVALPPGQLQLVTVDDTGLRGPATPAAPDRAGEHRLSPPAAGLLPYRVIGDDGAPLGARLVLLGPAGVRRTEYAATGRGELRLPPGTWRILAARGFEHELARRQVEVRAGRTSPLVELALRRVIKTRGWVAADLHLHAEGSGDSEARFADRVRSLVAEGVEVAVATDHNRVSDYGPAVSALGLSDRIKVMSGSEVSTTGEVRWGHFNAFPLERSPPHHDTTPTALFAGIRRAGERVIQVNHPRMPPKIGYFDLAGLDTTTGQATAGAWSDDFDVIEVFNGIWLTFPDRVRANLADWYALLNRGLRVTAAGNSDSHKLVQQEVGWPRTYIRTDEDDPARLTDGGVVAALRAGRTLVTSGPFIRMNVDGQGPGGVVHPGGRPTLPLEVWIHAPTWVPVTRASIVVDGETVWNLPVPAAAGPLRLHGRFDVRVEGARWIAVMAEGGEHSSPAAPVDKAWSVAFTSPVYVDHATLRP